MMILNTANFLGMKGRTLLTYSMIVSLAPAPLRSSVAFAASKTWKSEMFCRKSLALPSVGTRGY